MKFGAVMRAMRERAGMSQEDIADKTYLSQSCVSKFENDRKVPDIATMINWAEATNAKEIVIAFLYGMDGISILQSLMTIPGITSFIYI